MDNHFSGTKCLSGKIALIGAALQTFKMTIIIPNISIQALQDDPWVAGQRRQSCWETPTAGTLNKFDVY